MSEVTLEQLLALLEEENTKEVPTKNEAALLANHGERFLVDIGAQPGSYYVGQRSRNILIYWRYLKWCIENGERPLRRRSFFIQFAKYYKSKAMKIGPKDFKERVYPILPGPFEVSKEEERACEMVVRDEMEAEKRLAKCKRTKRKTKEMRKNTPASKKTSSPK